MLQAKICMLGATSVGKTSLVSRYVHSVFSDKYLTSIGVKIDKKVVRVRDRDVSLVLWDLYGDDEMQRLRMSYLRGAAGLILVVDGTRRETLQTAVRLSDLDPTLRDVPRIVALNKADLINQWELTREDQADLAQRGWPVFRTSAKTGFEVEAAFSELASRCVRAAQKEERR
jgi:small GTP-binding protein